MSVLTGQEPGTSGTPPGDGNQPPPATDWRAGLPDDVRGDKSLDSIKGKDWAEAGPVLVKNYINAQRLVGADKIILPTATSTPEDIATFRRKLGVPERPEDYGVKLPDGLKEEQLDKKLLETWKARLHKQGVPKAAAEQIISEYLADNLASNTARATAETQRQVKWETELKAQFGADYDRKVNLARHALDKMGSDGLKQILDETGMGSHPDVVAFFAKAGLAMADDRNRAPGYIDSRPSSAAGAQAAIEEFNKDEGKQKALWDKNHPSHEAVIKERAELFQMAAGAPRA